MNLNEIGRILHAVTRRLKNPQENPMTVRQMAWFYIQRKIYLQRHRLPAVQVPFTLANEDISPEPRIAVIVHCYYLDLMDEMLTHIRRIPLPYQLYVSTDTEEKRAEIIRQIEEHHIQAAVVRLAPNRGRDIAPKYITFRDVYDRCDYFLHLHSKKSPHTGSWGEEWRRHLLRTLVGSPEIIRSNLRLLKDPRLGLVFPVRVNDTLPALRWSANFAVSAELAHRLKVEIDPGYCLDYPDGGMFWGKTIAIKALLDLELHLDDFQVEKGQLDGCLNHAIERMVMHSASRHGLSGCRVSTSPACPNLRHAGDESALALAVSACLAAQEQERLKYDRPGRKSRFRNEP
jgi:lipopolysaccharide biosynthesis protein